MKPLLQRSKKLWKGSYKNLNNPIGLFGWIGELKVYFIKHHHHPLIEPIVKYDNIRFSSAGEIMAMKLAALLRRGVKKDFWDIHELLKHFSVKECI